MKNTFIKDVEQFISKNEDNIFRDIARLVAIDSVGGEPAPNAPFGSGPARALELALTMAEELGLKAVNCENMIGYAGLGEGDRYLATVTHLDTVPAGEGWSGDPLVMRERDGFIIGRGVMDDKGPSVLCLYALKFFKERGTALRYPLRALLGINEEIAMEDVRYYLKKYPAPLFCFSPDSDFPLCNGEKGTYHGRVTARFALENIVDIKGGLARNAVPDKAEAWVRAESLTGCKNVDVVREDDLWHITAHGVGGHASAPQGTVNAIAVLIDFLLANGLTGKKESGFLSALSVLLSASDGSSLGIACRDEYFEPLTIIGGVIGVEDGRIYQCVDCRYPTAVNGEIIATALITLMGESAELTTERDAPPFYVSPDSPPVQACLKAYREISGDDSKPFTIGGGTYAREFPSAVSFGPEHPKRQFPSWAGRIHSVDEAACKAYFTEALKIYICAIEELEKLDF